jgi:hypothetical protein
MNSLVRDTDNSSTDLYCDSAHHREKIGIRFFALMQMMIVVD